VSEIYALFQFFGLGHYYPSKPADSKLAMIIRGTQFSYLCCFFTVLNALFIGIETDLSISNALRSPPQTNPDWVRYINLAFTAIFTVELVLRIVALGVWFFVGPEWAWHLFDVVLVALSVISDFAEGANLSFLRLLRTFRIVRVARIIRVVRFFEELRKMMLSITASLMSLMWALVFLALIMYLVSVFFVQGTTTAILNNRFSDEELEEAQIWYGTLPNAMFSLLCAFTGGIDWIEVHRPVASISWMYSCSFIFFIVFVDVGVLNVLTGIFVEKASDFHDRDLTVHCELRKLDEFVKEMLQLFNEFDPEHQGYITKDKFAHYLHNDRVEAFLASRQLDTTHARLLFQMLDHNASGRISIYEFVMGMLKLRGQARAYDVRVLLYEAACLRSFIERKLGPMSPVDVQSPERAAESLGQPWPSPEGLTSKTLNPKDASQ
jgi:hypothetical protein